MSTGYAESVKLTSDQEAALGLLADSLDPISLMAAIRRCDELVAEVRAIQFVHSQNLCRAANHLSAELATLKNDDGCTATRNGKRCVYFSGHKIPHRYEEG